MERNDVIKALEQCTTNKHWCGDCPYIPEDSCRGHLLEDALAIIRELTEENKSLHGAFKNLTQTIGTMYAGIVQKMVERLREKAKTIQCDESDRLWYEAVELADVEQIAQELLGGEQK